jgi:hypothetical protein
VLLLLIFLGQTKWLPEREKEREKGKKEVGEGLERSGGPLKT